MRQLACTVALAGSSFLPPALAQDAAIAVDPHKLLSLTSSDWNDDSRPDRAMLVQNADDDAAADLLISLSARDGSPVLVRAPRIAWVGGMWGQEPSLELAANGSLIVVSENETIGRERWRMALTLAYRGGAFVVGGFTWASRDSLEPDNASHCDINLFNGRGIRDDKPIASAMRALPVQEWDLDVFPEECRQAAR
jgi:hypothetical protein